MADQYSHSYQEIVLNRKFITLVFVTTSTVRSAVLKCVYKGVKSEKSFCDLDQFHIGLKKFKFINITTTNKVDYTKWKSSFCELN